jgi:hypothetical protein
MTTLPAQPAPGKADNTAASWGARADDLAAWTEKYVVNRADAWGGYNAEADRDKVLTRPDGSTYKLGATTTRPARRLRGQVVLTPGILARHFRARGPLDVVGLHSTAPDNTSKWGAVDIDWHGPTSTAPAVNLAAALAWYEALARRGFRPLLTDSNGAGGYHLLVLLAEAIPTPRVHYLMRRLVADHTRHGMAAAPETFPKQPVVRPRPDGSPGYGNWLRLPGRHHTRVHWSRVWDGARWLDGAGAASFILALPGDNPVLVPEAPPPAPAPDRQVAGSHAGGNLAGRIAAYMARLPNLAEGQGRDGVAYHFAAFLARDLDLADDISLAWLERWDAGNNPPKGKAALEEILANARRYGRNAAGSGLTPSAPRRDRHGHTIVTHRTEVG